MESLVEDPILEPAPSTTGLLPSTPVNTATCHLLNWLCPDGVIV
jgi:hypothetical protein